MGRPHTVRIPVHGFVDFDDWERDFINHPVFQRLRRIRQLAFSEHVYPGSTHSRFEHSIGVMHVATRLFDAVCPRSPHLKGWDREKQERARRFVRLAALLHDVGHGPFSHGAEEFAPIRENGDKLTHEDYSAALIQHEMQDVFDNRAQNTYGITGEEIADFYLGHSTLGDPNLMAMRELVESQLDADRMDYLLRDAHHCGVPYGRFDLDRIVDTLLFVQIDEAPRLAVTHNGWHSAEQLILARLMMFTGVYFHKTRIACDRHAGKCLGSFLQSQNLDTLPDPRSPEGRKSFLQLDDWGVYKWMLDNQSLTDVDALLFHRQDRRIEATSESPTQGELDRFTGQESCLLDAKIDCWSESAHKAWYKKDDPAQLFVQLDSKPAQPLSEVSSIVHGLKPVDQRMLFVPLNELESAKEVLGNPKGNSR